MSAPVTELFTGGLVNVKHPALLDAGELQRADDCVYRDNDEAIWRAPGRTALTSSALGTDVRGIGHLSFDTGFVDQFVMLTRRTDGTPTWSSGPDPAFPAFHLYGADFTAITGLAPTEIGGQNLWYGVVSGGTTLDTQQSIASVTISGTTLTAAANSFTNVAAGSVIAGTGITAGTRVLSVDSDTQITMDTAGSAGTQTLTFTQYPFLITAKGARVVGAGIGTNVRITDVTNQDGTTGHYRTATLSSAPAGGNIAYSFSASCGMAFDWNNTGREILDYVQYGAKKFYMWDGVGTLKVAEWRSRSLTTDATLGPVLSLRSAGMRPVVQAPTVAKQVVAGYGWNSVKGAGSYWILITEIYSPNSDIAAALKDPEQSAQIVESAYLGTPAASDSSAGSESGVGLPIPVSIANPATDSILVTFPAVVNSGKDGFLATHWGVYIYGPVSDLPSLAQLRRCATVTITQYTAGQTYTLSDNALSQTKYAGAYRAVGSRPTFSNPGYLLGAPDNANGRTQTGGSSKSIPTLSAQGLNTYGFSVGGAYSGLPVIGVEAQVRAKCNPSGDTTHQARYWCRVLVSGGTKSSDVYFHDVNNENFGVSIHGGPMDTMGIDWGTTDPQNVEVEIGIVPRGLKDELDVDCIAVKFYYTTVNVDFNGPAYRVVTYRDQVGLTVSDPARLLPPSPSTGDFFQGCLVLNNLGQENQIKYSLPGDPEAWPKPYELTFNTRKRDRVTFIKTLGTILFCGMENSLKRVNYLPTEANTDMSSGLAHEDIATDHGIPGPYCAVKFDMPGEGSLVAYASQVGPFLSNGIWTRPLNLDLDWANTVKVSALSTAVMKVYSKEKWIALYYCPAGATHNRNTRVLYFCYQADKLKQGPMGPVLPAVGPCVVSARAACEAWLNSTPYLITANEADGMVYVEDSGITIPPGYRVTLTATSADQGDGKATGDTDVSINPLIRTRKIYPAGVEQDAYGENLYVLYTSYGSRAVTATADAVSSSTTVSAGTAVFASVRAGMLISGTGIDGGTIVLSVAGDNKSIVISRAANTDAASGTLFTFDSGTIGVTVRASGISAAVAGRQTVYGSTTLGDLMSLRAPEISQGFELQFEKVPLTFDSNYDTLTWADLSVNLRMHQFTYVLLAAGKEMNRVT